MDRLYVGIACSSHDPAIALVSETGELVYAQGAERHLQDKRGWFAVPVSTEMVSRAVMPHVRPETQIVVACSWTMSGDVSPYTGALGDPTRLMGINPLQSMVFGSLATRASAYLQVRDLIARARADDHFKYAGQLVPLRCFDHHTTHAAYACHSSPYEEAVCAIVDGWGEESSTAFFRWHSGRLSPIEPARKLPPNTGGSLGFFYSSLCRACGFDPWTGEEWKVMGLAAYGRLDARLYDLLAPLVEVDDLELRRGFPDPFGRWREVRDYVGHGVSPRDCADLAFTGQKVFEDGCLALLRNLRTRGLSENLVFAGGCALNSSLNGKITAETGFRSLFVPSAPADDGTAAGAAWLAFEQDHPGSRRVPAVHSPYLGDELQERALRNAIEYGGLTPTSLGAETLEHRTARLLASGQIVGWAQGRAEFGPRALGNRSILADARNPQVKQVINSRIKFREEFRPFAPSILHERGPEYFERYEDSPYMDRTLAFRPSVRGKVPGVVHEDGTGRLQSVRRELNPRFHALIREFDALTGVPLLLNTSFNVMGKPIIHSVEDAIAVYMTSGLDALVTGDTLFEKRGY